MQTMAAWTGRVVTGFTFLPARLQRRNYLTAGNSHCTFAAENVGAKSRGAAQGEKRGTCLSGTMLKDEFCNGFLLFLCEHVWEARVKSSSAYRQTWWMLRVAAGYVKPAIKRWWRVAKFDIRVLCGEVPLQQRRLSSLVMVQWGSRGSWE